MSERRTTRGRMMSKRHCPCPPRRAQVPRDDSLALHQRDRAQRCRPAGRRSSGNSGPTVMSSGLVQRISRSGETAVTTIVLEMPSVHQRPKPPGLSLYCSNLYPTPCLPRGLRSGPFSQPVQRAARGQDRHVLHFPPVAANAVRPGRLLPASFGPVGLPTSTA